MIFALCMLALTATPVSVAEEDIVTVSHDDVTHIRYLSLDNIEEQKEREQYLAIVSFVLNSVSNKKKIVLPTFVDKDKTTIRFDLRNYGLDAKAYSEIGVDPYTKKSDKLKKLTNSENPLMRVDWFIIKSMAAPAYYKLMGVSNLQDFRKRHTDDGGAKKVRTEQAAVVVSSNLARNTRYLKRIPTFSGVIWESRDSASIDYLIDLLSDKYDSIQLLAINPNGLISYYAADSKGKPIDHLPVEIAVDHSRAFEPDLTVRVARNCVACHTTGVLPIDDHVRGIIKKDIKLISPDKDAADRLNEIFGEELPIKKDQEVYTEALAKVTGMTDAKAFTHKFVSVWTRYYSDLTLEQAAKELGKTPDEFKKECLASGQPHLLSLAVRGKIHRVHFEYMLTGK